VKWAIELADVTVRRNESIILEDVTWSVAEGEHWAILGSNGAGKTTLTELLSTQIFPSSGHVAVLGEILGLVDVFELRSRIGVSSSLMWDRFDPQALVIDTVRTAAYGMSGTWHETYDEVDTNRAASLLQIWGLEGFEARSLSTLSEGERKRTILARALMANPELLILDEPSAGLDFSARERLIQSLSQFLTSQVASTTILVTHHVEEIPAGITHVLLLKRGKVLAAGPIHDVLTDMNVSATYDHEISVFVHQTAHGNRWSMVSK